MELCDTGGTGRPPAGGDGSPGGTGNPRGQPRGPRGGNGYPAGGGGGSHGGSGNPTGQRRGPRRGTGNPTGQRPGPRGGNGGQSAVVDGSHGGTGNSTGQRRGPRRGTGNPTGQRPGPRGGNRGHTAVADGLHGGSENPTGQRRGPRGGMSNRTGQRLGPRGGNGGLTAGSDGLHGGSGNLTGQGCWPRGGMSHPTGQRLGPHGDTGGIGRRTAGGDGSPVGPGNPRGQSRGPRGGNGYPAGGGGGSHGGSGNPTGQRRGPRRGTGNPTGQRPGPRGSNGGQSAVVDGSHGGTGNSTGQRRGPRRGTGNPTGQRPGPRGGNGGQSAGVDGLQGGTGNSMGQRRGPRGGMGHPTGQRPGQRGGNRGHTAVADGLHGGSENPTGQRRGPHGGMSNRTGQRLGPRGGNGGLTAGSDGLHGGSGNLTGQGCWPRGGMSHPTGQRLGPHGDTGGTGRPTAGDGSPGGIGNAAKAGTTKLHPRLISVIFDNQCNYEVYLWQKPINGKRLECKLRSNTMHEPIKVHFELRMWVCAAPMVDKGGVRHGVRHPFFDELFEGNTVAITKDMFERMITFHNKASFPVSLRHFGMENTEAIVELASMERSNEVTVLLSDLPIQVRAVRNEGNSKELYRVRAPNVGRQYVSTQGEPFFEIPETAGVLFRNCYSHPVLISCPGSQQFEMQGKDRRIQPGLNLDQRYEVLDKNSGEPLYQDQEIFTLPQPQVGKNANGIFTIPEDVTTKGLVAIHNRSTHQIYHNPTSEQQTLSGRQGTTKKTAPPLSSSSNSSATALSPKRDKRKRGPCVAPLPGREDEDPLEVMDPKKGADRRKVKVSFHKSGGPRKKAPSNTGERQKDPHISAAPASNSAKPPRKTDASFPPADQSSSSSSKDQQATGFSGTSPPTKRFAPGSGVTSPSAKGAAAPMHVSLEGQQHPAPSGTKVVDTEKSLPFAEAGTPRKADSKAGRTNEVVDSGVDEMDIASPGFVESPAPADTPPVAMDALSSDGEDQEPDCKARKHRHQESVDGASMPGNDYSVEDNLLPPSSTNSMIKEDAQVEEADAIEDVPIDIVEALDLDEEIAKLDGQDNDNAMDGPTTLPCDTRPSHSWCTGLYGLWKAGKATVTLEQVQSPEFLLFSWARGRRGLDYCKEVSEEFQCWSQRCKGKHRFKAAFGKVQLKKPAKGTVHKMMCQCCVVMKVELMEDNNVRQHDACERERVRRQMWEFHMKHNSEHAMLKQIAQYWHAAAEMEDNFFWAESLARRQQEVWDDPSKGISQQHGKSWGKKDPEHALLAMGSIVRLEILLRKDGKEMKEPWFAEYVKVTFDGEKYKVKIHWKQVTKSYVERVFTPEFIALMRKCNEGDYLENHVTYDTSEVNPLPHRWMNVKSLACYNKFVDEEALFAYIRPGTTEKQYEVKTRRGAIMRVAKLNRLARQEFREDQEAVVDQQFVAKDCSWKKIQAGALPRTEEEDTGEEDVDYFEADLTTDFHGGSYACMGNAICATLSFYFPKEKILEVKRKIDAVELSHEGDDIEHEVRQAVTKVLPAVTFRRIRGNGQNKLQLMDLAQHQNRPMIARCVDALHYIGLTPTPPGISSNRPPEDLQPSEDLLPGVMMMEPTMARPLKASKKNCRTLVPPNAGGQEFGGFCHAWLMEIQAVPSDDDLRVAGWAKHWDANSKAHYYYPIDGSQQTTWVNPLGANDASTLGGHKGKPAARTGIESASVHIPGVPSDEDLHGAGWAKQWDTNHKAYYYYFIDGSQQTTWVNPLGANDASTLGGHKGKPAVRTGDESSSEEESSSGEYETDSSDKEDRKGKMVATAHEDRVSQAVGLTGLDFSDSDEEEASLPTKPGIFGLDGYGSSGSD